MNEGNSISPAETVFTKLKETNKRLDEVTAQLYSRLNCVLSTAQPMAVENKKKGELSVVSSGLLLGLNEEINRIQGNCGVLSEILTRLEL